MTTTPGSFTFFSQDGLDTIFWGFVFILVGTLLALLGIAHFAFSILGAIAAIIGWLFAIMGMSSLRRDYRTESKQEDHPLHRHQHLQQRQLAQHAGEL